MGPLAGWGWGSPWPVVFGGVPGVRNPPEQAGFQAPNVSSVTGHRGLPGARGSAPEPWMGVASFQVMGQALLRRPPAASEGFGPTCRCAVTGRSPPVADSTRDCRDRELFLQRGPQPLRASRTTSRWLPTLYRSPGALGRAWRGSGIWAGALPLGALGRGSENGAGTGGCGLQERTGVTRGRTARQR